MPKFLDAIGTLQNFLRIGVGGVRLKNVAGSLQLRNSTDSTDAALTASTVNVSGDALIINSDAANTGNDRSLTLQRPATMAANATLTLPNPGSPGQVLAFSDSSGTIVAVPNGAGPDKIGTDTTTLAFGSTSPLTLFTLPANAVVFAIRITIDTPFNGTATVSIGITGTPSKYVAATNGLLQEAANTPFEFYPGISPNASAESLIATYSAGGATVGSARIEIDYGIPT